MMICKVELKHELEQSLEAGMMTERFAVLAEEIVRGYFSQRSMSGYPSSVKDEFLSEFRHRIVRHWKKIDPGLNPFSAITQQGKWAGMTVIRKYKTRKRLIEKMVDNK